MSGRKRSVVVGTISSAAFASGDRFVVGNWSETPIGPMRDIMWGAADGTRTLIAPNDEAVDFITQIYEFDEIRLEPIAIATGVRELSITANDLTLTLVAGRARRIPARRPLWATRFIEAPIARRLMGVETSGTSPTGIREWYQASAWRWVHSAEASRGGRNLGAMVDFSPPIAVGFSEPPRRASIVSVRVTIDIGRSAVVAS